MLQSRWAMLAVIFLTRTAMGFQFQSVASVAPFLLEEFRLSYGQIGFLMGLYLLPGVVIALPGGMLGQRFGSRRPALGGLVLMVLGGLVIAQSQGFALACVGRAVSGAGGILLNLCLAKMVADWFTGKEISTAMAIMLTSWPVGIGLALATLGSTAGRSSWRASMLITAVAAALVLLLLAALYGNPPGLTSAATAGGGLRLDLSPRDWALSISAGAVWALLNAGFIAVVSFGPALLIARGASVGEAGLLVSLAIWVSMVSVPLGGYLVDRLGRPALAIVGGCLATALSIALVPLLPGPLLWLVLAGTMLGLAPGPIMALLPGVLKPEHLATGLGVLYTVFYLGMAVTQPLAGLARDLSGSPAMPLYFAAVVMAATAGALGVFRWLQRQGDAVRAGPPRV